MTETILIVEDNILTRNVVSITLTRRGYRVLEAGDGQTALTLFLAERPALVLQDLHLPDIDGIDLVERLRALPAGSSVPIIAFSGLMSRIEEARAMCAGFTDYLFKPVEPGRLLEVVDAYLAPRRLAAGRPGRGHRLLLASGDLVQARLDGRQFQELGFTVETVGDGLAAIAAAETVPPTAVLADLHLPGMNGMELCLAIRRHPTLARVPVVLTAATLAVTGGDEAHLAAQIGANAIVTRTAGLGDVATAVVAAIEGGLAPVPVGEADAVNTAFMGRLMKQLEHQAAINTKLSRRAAMDAALLSIMTRAAQVLTSGLDLPRLLDDVLGRALDAGGVSAGAIFLVEDDGAPVMRSQIGLPREAIDEMRQFHGHIELLRVLCQGDAPTVLPSPAVPDAISAHLLAHTQSAAIIVAPLRAGHVSHGALVMLSRSRDHGEAWLNSIGAVANQLGQAVTLSRTAAQLQRSEERHRSLFEGMPTGLFRSTPTGRMLDVNVELERLLGAPDRAALLRTPAGELYYDSVDRERWQAALAKDGEVRDYEVRLRRLDGEPIWVSVTARLIRGPDSQILSYEGAVVDISTRKALESQLMQSQKMEAIGQLAAGVAHDFNNMLTVISGYAQILREDGAEDPEQADSADQIIEAAQRAAALTRQLLAFGRRQVLQPVVLDLNDTVGAIEKMVERLIGEDVEVQSHFDPALVPVKLDPGQLEQVILNLAVNARDAMPRGGKIIIETRGCLFDASEAAVRDLAAPGQYAMLAVTDTGVGIPADILPQIFEPFFTTKPVGKGTGLGLSTVYGIVKQSGGNILVYSEPGVGTTFKLYFPAALAATRPASRRGMSAAPALGGPATILLAEDEDAVRRFVADALTRQGHRLLVARDGGEAMRLADASAGAIDLLVTDVIMPGMSGPDLSRRLVAARPDLRVLFMSGYAGEAIAEHGGLAAGAAFIEKPFSVGALLERVSQMLATPQ